MKLTKEGIVCDPWPGDDRDLGPDRPRNAMALLGYWHATLEEIDGDYTFGDLISLLRDVDDIEQLSGLLKCDVTGFLAEADQPRRVDDEVSWKFVEVRNVAVLTEYEPDHDMPDEHLSWMDDEEAAEHDQIDAGIAALTGERPPFKLVDATQDDPITGEPQQRRLRAPRQNGRWKPPYYLRREFDGRGRRAGIDGRDPGAAPQISDEVFALDFTPLSSLLHLPLRYNPEAQFWSGPLMGAGKVVFATELTITFGEFLHAIFAELGFHGSPADRDQRLAALRDRARALDRLRQDESE